MSEVDISPGSTSGGPDWWPFGICPDDFAAGDQLLTDMEERLRGLLSTAVVDADTDVGVAEGLQAADDALLAVRQDLHALRQWAGEIAGERTKVAVESGKLDFIIKDYLQRVGIVQTQRQEAQESLRRCMMLREMYQAHFNAASASSDVADDTLPALATEGREALIWGQKEQTFSLADRIRMRDEQAGQLRRKIAALDHELTSIQQEWSEGTGEQIEAKAQQLHVYLQELDELEAALRGRVDEVLSLLRRKRQQGQGTDTNAEELVPGGVFCRPATR